MSALVKLRVDANAKDESIDRSHDPLAWLPHEWEAWVRAQQLPAFRAKQILHWLHQRHVIDPDHMHNLPNSLRAALQNTGLNQPCPIEHAEIATDDTRKLRLRLHDGHVLETVLLPPLPHSDDDSTDDKTEQGQTAVTQCISTQVGCAMGCVFCASGVAGLQRHLSAAEIIGQVCAAKAHLPATYPIRRLVFMGMGEPLHNYVALKQALQLLIHPQGLGFAPRRMIVSTSGLIPRIKDLQRDFQGQVQLAISLHAPNDALRNRLVPVNRKYPLAELIACLHDYPQHSHHRITIEYTLLDAINDQLSHAGELSRLLKGLAAKVNLIPMNPVAGSAFKAPSKAQVRRFQDALRNAGIPVFVRKQRGDDVDAACGQLLLKSLQSKRPQRKKADATLSSMA